MDFSESIQREREIALQLVKDFKAHREALRDQVECLQERVRDTEQPSQPPLISNEEATSPETSLPIAISSGIAIEEGRTPGALSQSVPTQAYDQIPPSPMTAQAIRHERETAENLVQGLKAHREQLQRDLQERTALCEAQQTQLHSLQLKNQELSSLVGLLQGELETERTETSGRMDLVQQLRQQLDTSLNSAEAKNEELSAMVGVLQQQLETDQQEKQSEIDALQAELDAARQSSEAKPQEPQEGSNTAASEAINLRRRLVDERELFRQTEADLQTELKNAQDNLVELEEDLSQVRRELEQERASALVSGRAGAGGGDEEVALLQSQLEAAREAQGAAAQREQGLREQLSSEQRDRRQALSQLQQLQEQAQAAEAEAGASSGGDRGEGARAEMEQELAEARAEARSFQHRFDETTAELRAAIADLTSQLQTQKEAGVEAQAAADSKLQAEQALAGRYEEERNELRMELKQEQLQGEVVAQMLSQMQKQAETDRATTSNLMNELRAELDKERTTSQTLKEEMSSMKAQITRHEAASAVKISKELPNMNMYNEQMSALEQMKARVLEEAQIVARTEVELRSAEHRESNARATRTTETLYSLPRSEASKEREKLLLSSLEAKEKNDAMCMRALMIRPSSSVYSSPRSMRSLPQRVPFTFAKKQWRPASRANAGDMWKHPEHF